MPHTYSNLNNDRQTFTGVTGRLASEAELNQVLRVTSKPDGRVTDYRVSASAEPPGPGEAEAMVQLLKDSIDRQLGPGKGDEVFARAGMADATQVRGQDLARLKTQFDAVKQEVRNQLADPGRNVVQNWQQAGQDAQQPQPRAATQSLKELAEDPNVRWRVAESGGTGALLVITPDGHGAVIKVESQDATRQAVQASNSLEGAYGGPDGVFEVAPVTDESKNAEGMAALRTRLVAMAAEEQDPAKKDIINGHIAAIDQGGADLGVSKMGFVNGTQVNKLPVDDKVALVQTGQLARELGKAAVLCPQAQLGDHAGPANDERAQATTNLSNFMMGHDNGKLAPIDFDIKHGTPGVATGVEDLAALVHEATASGQGYENVIDRLVADAVEGSSQTCLADCMKALTSPGGSVEGVFVPAELEAVNGIVDTAAMRRQQAMALLDGVIEGFDYCQQNEQRMHEALGGPNGIPGPDMNRIQAATNSLNVPAIRQNVDVHRMRADPSLVSNAAARRLIENLKEGIESSKKVIASQKDVIDGIDQQIADLEQKKLNPPPPAKKSIFQTTSAAKKEQAAQIDAELAALKNSKREQEIMLRALEQKREQREQQLDQAVSNAHAAQQHMNVLQQPAPEVPVVRRGRSNAVSERSDNRIDRPVEETKNELSEDELAALDQGPLKKGSEIDSQEVGEETPKLTRSNSNRDLLASQSNSPRREGPAQENSNGAKWTPAKPAGGSSSLKTSL